jgi:hypothetical protein
MEAIRPPGLGLVHSFVLIPAGLMSIRNEFSQTDAHALMILPSPAPWNDIGVNEVLSLEEQWFTGELCERISKTIAEI